MPKDSPVLAGRLVSGALDKYEIGGLVPEACYYLVAKGILGNATRLALQFGDKDSREFMLGEDAARWMIMIGLDPAAVRRQFLELEANGGFSND